MIDDLAAFVEEFSMADRDRWRNAPPEAGYQDFGTLAWKVQNMKNFAATRRNSVLSQIPLELSVNHQLTSASGLLFSATPDVRLFGRSHAIDNRQVLVNGTPAA